MQCGITHKDKADLRAHIYWHLINTTWGNPGVNL
jgi:hypothetical protein